MQLIWRVAQSMTYRSQTIAACQRLSVLLNWAVYNSRPTSPNRHMDVLDGRRRFKMSRNRVNGGSCVALNNRNACLCNGSSLVQ